MGIRLNVGKSTSEWVSACVCVEVPDEELDSDGVSVPLGIPEGLEVDRPLRVCEDVTEAVGVAVGV